MDNEILTEPIVECEAVTQPKKRKHRFEFSKIMALIAVSMWLFVNFFGMGMMIYTLDLSPMAYVIPSVDAVCGCVLAFYLWKAKYENQIKLKRIYGMSDYEFSQLAGHGDGGEDES